MARGGAAPVDGNSGKSDIALLAKGGRTNIFGFLLRLAARLPFLFIAGRLYGASVLGRFAYAILVIEFAAQLATLGLKRGLAQRLSSSSEPASHIVWDGLLIAGMASAIAVAVLAAVPEVMFPNSGINGHERLLPLTIFGIAWSEVALAALAYRHNVGATVTARAVVEPWTISIAALGLWFYSARDGLILSYAVSMTAALVASLVPLLRSYGLPQGWRPRVVPCSRWRVAMRRSPLPMRSNGARATSIGRSWASFSPLRSLASIGWRNRSPRFRRSSRPASIPYWVR